MALQLDTLRILHGQLQRKFFATLEQHKANSNERKQKL